MKNDFLHSFLYSEYTPDITTDASEILCGLATPAEADMIRILALNTIYNGNVPAEKLKKRLRYTKPWAYYDDILHQEFESVTQQKQFTQALIDLSEQNIYALNVTDMRKSCPYHDALGGLPVLYHKDGTISDMKNGVLKSIRKMAANLNLDYRDILSFKDLSEQFYHLNTGNIRQNRYNMLNQYIDVRYIKKHPHFEKLNGQRGVFAKNDIQAGTVLGYYSGDCGYMGDDMPPLLCSWPVGIYYNKLTFTIRRNMMHTYLRWTDGYITGNAMKLVNTAAPIASRRNPVAVKNKPSYGNIACYFGHFQTDDVHKYISIPFYIAIQNIKKDDELMTFYPI